ncbi:MAG: hypothetical protein RBR15_17495 [Sphaerochaeta sp.]|nr:hypothetical protein [Sphaerochaeta sp.]
MLTGCSTTTGGGAGKQGEESALALLDLGSHPANVYVGVSGPYSTKERMVEAAILACAKSILLERALALDNRLVMQSSSSAGLLSFAQREKAYYDDKSLTEVIDGLEVLSIMFDPQAGSVVRARYPANPSSRRSYKATIGEGGRPDWLLSLPKVAGYRFGVGSSKAYYFLNDSLEASDFSAAQNLLDLYTEHAFSKGLVTTRGGSASSMDNVLYQAQRGLLQGFTIVDRYYDKECDTYWSLASILE